MLGIRLMGLLLVGLVVVLRGEGMAYREARWMLMLRGVGYVV